MSDAGVGPSIDEILVDLAGGQQLVLLALITALEESGAIDRQKLIGALEMVQAFAHEQRPDHPLGASRGDTLLARLLTEALRDPTEQPGWVPLIIPGGQG